MFTGVTIQALPDFASVNKPASFPERVKIVVSLAPTKSGTIKRFEVV